MDLDEHIHLQDGTVGLFGKFVRAVTGADGDGQSIQTGFLDEFDCLVGIGHVLQTGAASAVSVLNAAQAADLAFHRDSLGVGQADHFARGLDVVFKAGGRLAIRHQRPIHHDAGEAQFDGRLAGFHAVAVVEVHDQGNLGIEFRCCQHQVIQELVLRIRARAAAGLNNDRRARLLGRFHDCLNLLHVIDVESSNTVAAFGRFV